MGRFITGADRNQTTLFPPCVDDWIGEDNPVRAVDAFVDALDLGELGLLVLSLLRRGALLIIPHFCSSCTFTAI
jgi:hypothetical protein